MLTFFIAIIQVPSLGSCHCFNCVMINMKDDVKVSLQNRNNSHNLSYMLSLMKNKFWRRFLIHRKSNQLIKQYSTNSNQLFNPSWNKSIQYWYNLKKQIHTYTVNKPPSRSCQYECLCRKRILPCTRSRPFTKSSLSYMWWFPSCILCRELTTCWKTWSWISLRKMYKWGVPWNV